MQNRLKFPNKCTGRKMALNFLTIDLRIMFTKLIHNAILDARLVQECVQ